MKQQWLNTTDGNASTPFLFSKSTKAGLHLVVGTIFSYSAMVFFVLAIVPYFHEESGGSGDEDSSGSGGNKLVHGALEQQVCLIVLTMQCSSIIIDLFTRQQFEQITDLWTRYNIFCVKVLSAIANLAILTMPSTIVLDSMTGRPNCMLRWAEWTVLSFTMTFIVEAVDSKRDDYLTAIVTAGSQCVSTFCGMLLPVVSSSPIVWCVMLAVSFLLYSYIFVRHHAKKAALAALRASHAGDSYVLQRAELGHKLMKQCVLTWSLLVVVWSTDAAARLLYGPKCMTTDWAFIADTICDFIAKILYSQSITENYDAAPVRYTLERQRVDEGRLRALWEDSRDVLMVSQRVGSGGEVITFASPSVAVLVETKDDVASWLEGRIRPLMSPPTLDVHERIQCESLDELVSCTWAYSSFMASIASPHAASIGGEGRMVLEVRASTNEQLGGDGRVIVACDISERIRRLDAEQQAVTTRLAREKDEEANRFTRHEVKNSVLSALVQCDQLQACHKAAVADGGVKSVHYGKELSAMLGGLRSGLTQTLETVLSHAMAREVVSGVYVCRTLPVKVDEVLRVREGYSFGGAGGEGDGGRFPLTTTPRVMPLVDIDPRLLQHVHRNAVSNAVKYGKKGGRIETEVEIADHILTVRVINEPGVNHDYLVEEVDPALIFHKGARLHRNDPSGQSMGVSSRGDGAWIMQKCAHCLQGSCTYRFEKSKTCFELTCPALERLDEQWLEKANLGELDVWAVFVDDCDFQRMILEQIACQLGLPDERVKILGGEPDEVEHIAEHLVRTMKSLPPRARLLAIVDENLDLPEPRMLTVSGSYAIKRAREALNADEESRMLALVRSANDSPDDVRLFCERAHGFLSKCPHESERKSILRQWFKQFGASMAGHHASPPSSFKRGGVDFGSAALAAKQGDAAAADGHHSLHSHNYNIEDGARAVAAAEVRKLALQLDESRGMQWVEQWRYLHRIKGTIATLRVCRSAVDDRPALSPEEFVSTEEICETIEALRSSTSTPPDLPETWAQLKAALAPFMQHDHEPGPAANKVRQGRRSKDEWLS